MSPAPKLVKFDQAMAHRCAVLSGMAYLSPSDMIETYTRKLVIEPGTRYEAEFISANNAEAYAVVIGDDLYFALRGTQVTVNWSWKDIIDNVRIEKHHWGGKGLVHRGYKSYVNDLASEITRCLKAYRSDRVIFTGHSLGGATATIAHARFGGDLCYTFGAPRSGDSTFAKSVKNLFRITHANDIAPKYPTPIITGYRHAGEHWILYHDGHVGYNQWNYWNQLIVPFTRKGVRQGVLDHRVDEYVAKLAGVEL